MSVAEPAGQKIARNLQDAIKRLQEDMARVEMWAGALGCFSQPVPGYDPNSQDLKRFTLKPAARERASASANGKKASSADGPGD